MLLRARLKKTVRVKSEFSKAKSRQSERSVRLGKGLLVARATLDILGSVALSRMPKGVERQKRGTRQLLLLSQKRQWE